MAEEIKTTRCTICGSEFSENELIGVACCPKCGTKKLPCSIADDVTIKINWHELRVLVIWAENWARQIDKEQENKQEEGWKDPFNHLYSIMTIAERIQKQHPDKETKLTLFGEIRQLRKDLAKEDIKIETDIDSDVNLC